MVSTRLTLFALTLLGGVAAAQPKPPVAPPNPVTQAGATPARGLPTRAEFEAWMDGFMGGLMTDKHVAGATVSVVKDGQLFFAKGYGFADVETRKPVDPERTMFRIGSISKLFTWTSVMQQVERGKLDLSKDVNEYLEWKIPATYPEPITLTHILTHTPGFEEDSRDLFTDDPARVTPQGTWLPAHLPRRVRPPGTFSSYSNWATAAAGHIVERQSGLSWDEYIKQNILDPLGMSHSTGAQPLPAQFAEDMSQGYKWANGRFEPQKWEIVTGAPAAGSMAASATDMAKFMLAHLNNGALGEVRILADSTAARMYQRIQGHDPRLPGFAHGFYEQSSHGLRIYGHGGDTQWFHSDLALIPSERIGLFVSFNTDRGGALSFEPFLRGFLDQYFARALPAIAPTPEAKQGAKRYGGEYLANRRNLSSFQKFFSLAGPSTVTPTEDGALLVSGLGTDPTRFVAVDSMLFRDVKSETQVAFRADDRGNITHFFVSSVPIQAWDKQTGLASPRLHMVVLGGGLVLFGGILIGALQRFFRRRARIEIPSPPSIAAGRRVMTWTALLVAAMVALLAGAASDPIKLLLGTPPATFRLGLWLPVVGLLLTLAGLWYSVVQWQRKEGTTLHRLRHLGAVLVALLFFWSLSFWNLVGWKA